MSRPSLQEVNFQEFKRALENAIATGARITPREKDRWARYIEAQGIRETNVRAYGFGMYADLEPVIIDGDSPAGGYYLWSAAEEVALRWRRS